MKAETLQKVSRIIEDTSNIQLSDIDPNKNLREQVLLDSMQFLAVIAALEKGLNIDIPISAMEANSLDEFFQILDKSINNT
jgi:acyl carrier protein